MRKYSISALCRCLGIARSTYYYVCHDPRDESSLEEAVQVAYDENRRVYGQRKLKRVLSRKGWTVSRRRIGRIMTKRGLVSAYTCKKYRAYSSKSNEAATPTFWPGFQQSGAWSLCRERFDLCPCWNKMGVYLHPA